MYRIQRTRARSSRRTASLALRPLRRQSGVLLQAELLILAKAEVRPRRLCPVAPTHVTRDTSVVAEVRIERASGEFRLDSVVERLPPTAVARGNIRFVSRFKRIS